LYKQALEGYRHAMERVPELPLYYLIVAKLLANKLEKPAEAMEILKQAELLEYAQVLYANLCVCW
jgi:hypothetical protein